MTERKKTGEDGESEKHRIFLYKEDLNKFMEALSKATNHIKEELMPDYDFTKFDRKPNHESESSDGLVESTKEDSEKPK